jgi:hypothetical protein
LIHGIDTGGSGTFRVLMSTPIISKCHHLRPVYFEKFDAVAMLSENSSSLSFSALPSGI